MNTLIVNLKIVKTTIIIFIIVFTFQSLGSCVLNKNTIQPTNPIPAKRQLTWQKMEYYAFIHFNYAIYLFINQFINLFIYLLYY